MLSQIIWDTRGNPPKIVSNEEGGHHMLQEPSVKFTSTPASLPPY